MLSRCPFNSQKSIPVVSFFAIIKISRPTLISVLVFFKISFKTLLILFLKTAPPTFFPIPNPALTEFSTSALLNIYIIKYLSFLYIPSLITLLKSLFLLSVSNFILTLSSIPQAEIFFLPFLLLFAITALPDFFCILTLKPWFFFLFLTFG